MLIIAIAVTLTLILGGFYALKEMKRHEEAKARTRVRSLQAAVELTELLDRQRGPRPAGQHSQPWRNRKDIA